MEKISSLIPPPRSNIIRFHGVLAPNSKDRSKVVLKMKDSVTVTKDDKKKSSRISWAKLLKRVFMIDVLKCPYCENKSRKIVAAIQNPESVKRYLRHIGIDSDPPYVHPARNLQLSLGF